MSVKELAVRASEMPEKNIGKGANKAIKALPQQEQIKFRGALMVVTGFALLISGLKMLKSKNVYFGKPRREAAF